MVDVPTLPLTSLAEEIRTRRLSPVEVVRACLARIEAHDRTLGAFITLLEEQAMGEARKAEAAILSGDYRGPLHGIPMTLKDVFVTKGIRTTAGSKILADWIPDYDATVVERLRQAGTVLLGKVHVTEFALWATGGHPLYRLPRNPWDPARIPGGSSTGSAVSVAAAFCAASLGSDSGGSVRIPASFCGLVGLKPTYGVVSRHGVIPDCWSHQHVGVLARTVRDVATVFMTIAGRDPKDPTSVPGRPLDFSKVIRGDLRGLRVGVHRRMFFEMLDEEVRAATERALVTLGELGANLEEVDIPLLPYAAPVSFIIQLTEMLAYHTRYLKTRIHEYGADVRKGLALGQFVLGHQYIQAQRAAKLLGRQVNDLLGRVDVMVTPTMSIFAPRIGEAKVRVNGGMVDINSAMGERTRLYNITGHPAVTVSCGFTRSGLPIGLQIGGRYFDENTVLGVAYAYEQQAGWFRRAPDLDRTAAS